MSFTELTFEEEQQLKAAANKAGITLPCTAEGKIDPYFVHSFRLGFLMGKTFEKYGAETTVEIANQVGKSSGLTAKLITKQ